MKETGQNELHKSNSLDDLCTILSTYIISEQFDSYENQRETRIILKLPNDDSIFSKLSEINT